MKYFLSLLLLASLSCIHPQVKIDPDLDQNSREYTVKSKLNFTLRPSIGFGEFKTQDLKIGPIVKDSGNDIVSIKQNNEFIQTDSMTKMRAQVRCESFSQTSYSHIGKWKTEGEGTHYYKIDINTDLHIILDFQNRSITSLSDVKNLLKNFTDSGSRHSTTIVFKYDTFNLKIENLGFGTKDSCFTGFYLYENEKRVVGIYSPYSKPRIWIRNDMDEKLRVIFASITTALLLQNSLKTSQ